ncbi:hypothetical protein ACWDA7_39290 [Streptomyces sp. NPDC001156]
MGAAGGDTVVTDDGTLAAWLRASRADAVLLRPDHIVLDTVTAGRMGRRVLDTATWAPLLYTTRHRGVMPPTGQPDETPPHR